MAFEQNKAFYENSIKEYGFNAKGLHWNNRNNQMKRFDILVDFIKYDITNSYIGDAGCGFGDLCGFLEQKRLKPKKYIGYDSEEVIIQEAKRRYPKYDFEIKNILQDEIKVVDYYICSGAINILSVKESFEFIKNIYSYSKKGICFNFLVGTNYNGIRADDVLDFCSTFTKNIRTKEYYIENDFSVLLRK
jgi:SAM-dependent methyltransferase